MQRLLSWLRQGRWAKARRRVEDTWQKLRRTLGEFVYGMTVYDMVRQVCREQANVERLFLALTFGDWMGLPLLPGYHRLRLLPYVMPRLEPWRRGTLRERDLTELGEQDIG